jgi:intron-binding protein aquarius
MQSDLVVPDWIHDVLLGYGRRDSAHFQNVENPTRTIDFGWTFLNGKHLKESFENEFRIRYANGDISKSEGPFIATFPKASFLALEDEQEDEQQIASPKTNGKRGAEEKSHLGNLIVRSYHMPSLISDPKRNTIPFTRSQIQAIRSGSSNGLTLIVGPPGTGKTDVAVQIISNLYMQKERILLITRSNQALNHLFEKISKSNIKVTNYFDV